MTGRILGMGMGVVLGAGILLSGCATTNRFQNFQSDAIVVDKEFTAVAYWHLRLRDFTGKLGNVAPCFYVSSFDDAKKQWEPCAEGDSWVSLPYVGVQKAVGGWSTENGVPVLDLTLFKKVKPGKYLFDRLRLNSNVLAAVTGSPYTYVDLYLDRCVSLEPGKASYLGSFDVDILASQGKAVGFTSFVTQSDADSAACYDRFGKEYPQLAATLKAARTTATLSPLEPRDCPSVVLDERFLENERHWMTVPNGALYNMYFENCSYIIETKANRTTSSPIKIEGLPFVPKAPEFYTDCNIELVSRWQSGTPEFPFGFTVGASALQYCFYISKNGRAAVYENRGGNYDMVLPWTECGPFPDDKEIRQTVCVSQGSAAYYVNGKYVGRIGTSLKAGMDKLLGLSVSGQQKVVFKRLTVSAPQK